MSSVWLVSFEENVILPETAKSGDILGIFSSDGNCYRGTVRVREMFPGPPPQIGFDGPLPVGTTQGDILCLIRRGDEGTQVEAIMPTGLVVPLSVYRGAIAAVQQVQLESSLYKAECSLLREQLARTQYERDEAVRNRDLRIQSSDAEIRRWAIQLRSEIESRIPSFKVPEKQNGVASLPVRRIKSSSK